MRRALLSFRQQASLWRFGVTALMVLTMLGTMFTSPEIPGIPGVTRPAPALATDITLNDTIVWNVQYDYPGALFVAAIHRTETWTETITNVNITKESESCFETTATYSQLPYRRMPGGLSFITITIQQNGKVWRSINDKDTYQVYQVANASVGGMAYNDVYYRNFSGTHGLPTSLGQTWTYNVVVDSSNDMGDSTTAFTAVVAGSLESVTVPAGTFPSCYKVTRTASNGSITEWWDSTGTFDLAPVKIQDNYNFSGVQVQSLQSYPTTAVAPTVATNAASSVGGNSATLNGNLSALGTDTSVDVSFEWGTTTGYGNETTPQSVGATGGFTADLSSLSPGTEYHFRAKAVGDGLTAYGSDQTFTTDSLPTLSFSSATYSAGEADGTATITVNLSPAASGTVTVNYATSNGSATAGSDYTAASGTLTFVASDVQETFTIPITNDTDVEPSETVSIALSSPSANAALGTPNTATLTINDNDVPEVAFSSATYSIAEDGSGSATITVNLSEAGYSTITVGYATSNGSATAGSDYTAASGTLTFTAGDTQETFTVPITNDSDVEGSETVSLALSSPVGATLGAQNTATLTINDDDVPSITFSSAAYSVAEDGGSATITVNLSAVASGTVTVNYATSNGSATAGSDYTATSGTLTFNPGDTTENFTVSITNDGAAEGDETINLTLSSATGPASIGGTNPATLTINDDDVPPIGFSSATYTGAEGSGPVIITVNMGSPSGATVTVDYATSNGTASSGVDYGSSTGTLTFPPGDTTKTFSVSINDDAFVEADETVIVTLSNASNASISGINPATLTITSEDIPEVSFASATYSGAENGGNVTVAAMVSPVHPGTAVTVNYATSDGTATAGSDYTAASGTLTFNPGDVFQSFSVSLTNDSVIDPLTETIILTLSSPVNATLGTPNPATLTINDDDGVAPTVSTSAATNVGETSATLRGNVSSFGSASSAGIYFDWGTTSAFGHSTFVANMNSTGGFSKTITGLDEGQNYYFRARAEGDRTGYGSILRFETDAPYIPPEEDDVTPEATPTPTPETEPEPVTSNTGEAPLPLDDEGIVETDVIIISEDGISTLVIPAGTAAIDNQGVPQNNHITNELGSPPPTAPPADNVIAMYEMGPDGTVFDQPVTITMSYDPANLPEGVAEEDLIIAFFDEVAGEWVPLDDIVVDTENNTISGTVTHFTTFGVLLPETTTQPVVDDDDDAVDDDDSAVIDDDDDAVVDDDDSAVIDDDDDAVGDDDNSAVIDDDDDPVGDGNDEVIIDEDDGDSTPVQLIVGVVVFGFVIIGLGIYFYSIMRRRQFG